MLSGLSPFHTLYSRAERKEGIERIRTVVINYYRHKIKLNELPLGERWHQLLKIARTERLLIESMVVQYKDKQDGDLEV